MISMKSKWSLWVKVLFLKKNFYRSYHAAFPYWRTFFRWLKPSLTWKFIIKELWCRCPLTYRWKGLSAWWSCFFNDRWFDKEQALCIALHSLAKSERGLAGRRNSVEHGNVSGIWFHVKGFVYDNHNYASNVSTYRKLLWWNTRTIFDLSISSNHKYTYLAILWYSSFDEELKKTFAWSKKILFRLLH